DDARLSVGITADEETAVQGRLEDEKLIPRTVHARIGSDGRTRYRGVWGRSPGVAITGQTHRDQFQGNFAQDQADLSDQLLLDLAVSGTSQPRAIRERAQAALEAAEEKLKTRPDDLDSRLSRAMAHFRLGEDQKALDDLGLVIGKDPESIPAKQYRVIALARLGRKQDALTELTSFQKEAVPESSKLSLATVVAAELGDGAEKRVEVLEAAIRDHPQDADLRYDAARAFSLASRAVSRSDQARGRQLAERCLQWLREAVKDGDADFGKMDEDGDLDPIRDDPEFAESMKAGKPAHRHASGGTSEP